MRKAEIRGKQRSSSVLLQHNGHMVLLQKESSVAIQIHIGDQSGHGLERNCRRVKASELESLVAEAREKGERLVVLEAKGAKASMPRRKVRGALKYLAEL